MSYPVMSTSVPWSLVKNGFHKTPSFKNGTLKTESASGRRTSLTVKPFPTWDFSVDLNLVQGGPQQQGSILQMFLGCFTATCGGAGFFLFTDPTDNTVDDTGLVTPQSCMFAAPNGALQQTQTKGDGATTTFQLARKIDQGFDILQQVSNVQVYVNGTLTSASVSAAGVVTFSVAPALGAALTWKGNFQYLCQFSDDSIKDLAALNKNNSGFLWSGTVAFESLFV